MERRPAPGLLALQEHAGAQLGVAGKRSWFINDGIHHTSVGYEARGQQIAEGLARAFPAGGRSKGCAVSQPGSRGRYRGPRL